LEVLFLSLFLPSIDEFVKSYIMPFRGTGLRLVCLRHGFYRSNNFYEAINALVGRKGENFIQALPYWFVHLSSFSKASSTAL